ncbi:alpha/beta hydrolase [Hydrogenophaga sp. SNF1]|uniref:alpha/beta fold hydrolase n=1 Tax=Hydrogenophaga sp. SNF1 TaxID=3098762 RepID=UPI002ACC1A26|nr:alpha/beta hydrolase [Hydrogenophaga sp. SNF1]WQB85821.1 alpha/beta hydrolase [Hydrogenophaga sp. SNF1]
MANPSIDRSAQTLECRLVGQGAPLLLLHGIQGTSEAWAPVLPALLARRCVLPNLPGRGLSPRWRADQPMAHASYYHLDHYADLVHALVTELAQRTGSPVAVAGWSMGVSVILNLLARHGDAALERLVLVSGTACATPGAVWFRGETPEALEREARERAERLQLKAVADADAVAASWASVRGADLRAVARGIRRPTLVVHGDRDGDCPFEHGRWLADHVPGAAWLPLPGVGHSVMTQAGEALGSSMSAFLGS